MTKEELIRELEDVLARFKGVSKTEELSADNADIVDISDKLEIRALLEHWGHKVRLYSGTSSNTGKRYYYIDTIDGVSYRGDVEGANKAIIRIINSHLDENGIVII